VVSVEANDEEEVTISVAKMTAGGAVICSEVAEAWSEEVVGRNDGPEVKRLVMEDVEAAACRMAWVDLDVLVGGFSPVFSGKV
jgi:hypothetical protein